MRDPLSVVVEVVVLSFTKLFPPELAPGLGKATQHHEFASNEVAIALEQPVAGSD